MNAFHTYTVSDEHTGFTVEEYLKQVLHYSGRFIQKLTRKKGIHLNGKAVYLQKKVKPRDTLAVMKLTDTAYGVQPEPGVIELLYEDEYLLILNKPAYQLVHPTGQTTSGTLANHLAYHLEKQKILSTVRPLHRLDRNTSGCVVFAKDARSQFLLEQQLKDRTLKRIYQALVSGTPEPAFGTIAAPVGPHPNRPNCRAVTNKGEEAITHYRTIQSFLSTSLLELSLDTGRTHQIRVHLSHIGYPVIGDNMYGLRSLFIPRQALHATAITFLHIKDNREITVTAPIPDDITSALEFYRAQV